MTKPFERKGSKWHSVTPIVKAIELMMAEQYNQKFLYCQALTNRLQIEQIISEHYNN